MKHISRAGVMLAAGGLFWLAAVGVGLRAMERYDGTAGTSGAALERWPAGSGIPRHAGRPILVMLAHPQCPCSRASVEELDSVMAHANGGLDACVLFYVPSGGAAKGWRTGLWRRSAAIPGVSVLPDENGVTARRFGADTSGETMLYDAAGHLVFRGGVTDGRGHGGDSVGRDAIVAFLSTGRSTRRSTPVFGCSLRGLDAGTRKG